MYVYIYKNLKLNLKRSEIIIHQQGHRSNYNAMTQHCLSKDEIVKLYTCK